MSASNGSLTVRQVAELFQVTPATVRGWIRDGKLSSVSKTPGGQLRIRASSIEALLGGSSE